MRCSHHTLSVDLDDAMANTDPTTLSNAPSHEAADLSRHSRVSRVLPCPWVLPKDGRTEMPCREEPEGQIPLHAAPECVNTAVHGDTCF